MRKLIISITVITLILITIVLAINPAYSQELSSPNFKMDISLLTNGGGSAKSSNFQLVSSALGGLPAPQTFSSSNFKLDNAKVLNPISPPAITLVDTDNNATAGSPKLIKAAIIFSTSTSVSAKLFYMTGGKTFSAFDMVAIAAATSVTTGNPKKVQTFSGSIPASAVTLSGLAYYIKATLAFGASAFFPPETATDPKKAIALNVSGDISGPEIETNNIFTQVTFPRWQTPDDWSMVSFPFELLNDDPEAVFAPLGQVEAEWQVYRYEGGADYTRAIAMKRPNHPKGDIEKFNSIQRGKAAWIYSPKGGALSIKGAKAANPLVSFPIKVNAGWNQIGNPFRFSRFWNAETVKFSAKADGSDAIDILAASKANKLIPTLYWRQGQDYTKISADPNVKGFGFATFPGIFEAWNGYLILMKADGYLWIEPTVPGPAINLAAAPIYAAADGAKGWMVEIEAMIEPTGRAEEQKSGRGKTITVGMWEGAMEEEDNFDSPAAPFIASASDSLEFSIPHPEWNNPWAKNYQQDLRAYAGKNSAYWEIAVGATHASPLQAPITLTWRETYRLPDRYMLYLVDPSGEAGGKNYKVINLRQETSYTLYANKEGKKLYLIATRDALGLPEFLAKLLINQTLVYQNYPNPFNPETWIPYQLSNAGEVSLRIYDVAGRLVRTLNLGRKEVGIYVSTDKAAYWDGKNDYGERVASGIYFYELRAGVEFRAVKKMVVLK